MRISKDRSLATTERRNATIETEASGEAGYSLIEVLVSLALMASLISIVGLALSRPIEALAFKRAQSDLNDVVLRGRNVSMLTSSDADLASIWATVRTPETAHDLVFLAGTVGPYGACRAGRGDVVLADDVRVPFAIAPVTCHVTFPTRS